VRNFNAQTHRLFGARAQTNLLDVQNQSLRVFPHMRNRSELVVNPTNSNRRNGRTLQAGKQNTPQRIA
jgi:hypothetical protein